MRKKDAINQNERQDNRRKAILSFTVSSSLIFFEQTTLGKCGMTESLLKSARNPFPNYKRRYIPAIIFR